jgi:hypothetical protein
MFLGAAEAEEAPDDFGALRHRGINAKDFRSVGYKNPSR